MERQPQKKIEDDLKNNKKWKTNQSTKINLIVCDTIVNSPSFLFLLKIGDLSLYPVYWWSGYSARTEFTKQLGITMRPPFFLEFSLIISIQINTWQNKGCKSKSQFFLK